MLLTIDVGNTNITFGCFKDETQICSFRLMTKQARTSDEYGIFMVEFLRHFGVEPDEIEGAIIASVVPNVMHSLVGWHKGYSYYLYTNRFAEF